MRGSVRNIDLSTVALLGAGIWVALGVSSCAPAVSHNIDEAPTHASQPISFSEYDPSNFHARALQPPELPASVELPPAISCQFHAGEWRGSIRLAAGGPVLAEIDKAANANVTLPEGDASQGATIDLELRGLKLRAVVATLDLKLFPTHPVVIDGYVIPYGFTALALEKASAGKVCVSAPPITKLQSRVKPRGALLNCDELALEVQFFEPTPSAADRAPVAHWRGSPDVPLRLKPDGNIVAALDTRPEKLEDGITPEPDEVAILAVQGAFRRVLWTADTGVVIGWVHAKFLGPSEPYGMIGLLNTGAAFSPPEPLHAFSDDDPTQTRSGSAAQACAWNAPLIATAGGVTRTVGTIASGIPFTLGQKHNGLRAVHVEHPALSIPETTTLWVPENLVYPCVVPVADSKFQ